MSALVKGWAVVVDWPNEQGEPILRYHTWAHDAVADYNAVRASYKPEARKKVTLCKLSVMTPTPTQGASK